MTELEFLREILRQAFNALEVQAIRLPELEPGTASEGAAAFANDLAPLATEVVREGLKRLFQASTLDEIRQFMLTGDGDALLLRLPSIFA